MAVFDSQEHADVCTARKEVLLVGTGSKVEIWNRSVYEKHLIQDPGELSKLAEVPERVMCPAPGVQFNFSFMLLQAASGRLQSLQYKVKGVKAPDVHGKLKNRNANRSKRCITGRSC